MSHLMLSRHGIWYYRRVYLTPRKRREIRISLRTRSKREAMQRAEQYIISQPFHCVPQSIPSHTATPSASFQQPQRKRPFKSLKSELDKYIKGKAGSVGEREIMTINRCVNAYLNSTKEPFSKRSSAAFVDDLEGSASTRNRYIKKNSAFFKWLATRTDEEIRNPFEGMGVKETTAPMDRRPAYTSNDLKRLHIALHGVRDWKRWIILIGRYSGMRQNEICQLYHNDVMKVDGVWCFRVDNLNPNHTLKTDSSRRFVPIHSQLLALGLLDFINDRKGHLFSELTLYLGSYGHYFSRWFTGSGVSMVCLSIIRCDTTPPQHSNKMAFLSSSPPKCSDTRTQRSLTTDTEKAWMSRGWLNWWRSFKNMRRIAALKAYTPQILVCLWSGQHTCPVIFVTEAVISLINSSSLMSSGFKLGCIAVSGYLAYFSNSMYRPRVTVSAYSWSNNFLLVIFYP